MHSYDACLVLQAARGQLGPLCERLSVVCEVHTSACAFVACCIISDVAVTVWGCVSQPELPGEPDGSGPGRPCG